MTVTHRPTDRRAIEPTHPCVRCGRPVAIDTAMCEYCNPLGLADPAASQAHGTVFLAIGAAVVILALVGRLVVAGVGPFDGTVVGVTVAADASGAPSGLAITLTVTNHGTKSGPSTCRISDPDNLESDANAIFLSPDIPAGQSATFTRTTDRLGHALSSTIRVDCG
jgi:hypothetical protein